MLFGRFVSFIVLFVVVLGVHVYVYISNIIQIYRSLCCDRVYIRYMMAVRPSVCRLDRMEKTMF